MSAPMDTSRTVTALQSTFRNAISQLRQIVKRTKKKKSEQALKQKWLLETLESGEVQITQRYNQYLEELGERFKVGDGKSTHSIMMK
jgi:ribosomal protein L22